MGAPARRGAARRAAGFLLERCVADGRVRRSWQGGAAPLPGYLDDHGALANALLSLFECDGDPRWLAAGQGVLEATVAHFSAEDGSFFYTADDHEQLLARTKSASEGATRDGAHLGTHAGGDGGPTSFAGMFSGNLSDAMGAKPTR